MKSDEPFAYEGLDPLNPAIAPELVFGIVASVGAERKNLIVHLENELREYNYETNLIKLSGLIELVPKYENSKISTKQEPERIFGLMDAGNQIRKESVLGDALAILAITEIREKRREMQEKVGKLADDSPERYAYILDSLKHPDEIQTLRAVYGQGFILVSGYSRRNKRVENLAAKIAKSRCDPQGFEAYKANAEELIQRDHDDGGLKYGQKVKKCFPEADFFIDLDDSEAEQKKVIERYLRIIFNDPFVTPFRDEMGMFHAEAASWRSSDLSRQVGAAICSPEGDMLAVGCNEAPKAFGGLYWDGDKVDGRDFQRGKNEGSDQKRLIVAEIFDRLLSEETFTSVSSRLSELRSKVLDGDPDSVLNDLQALNVIEYGRTVHAEMAALTDAAARGIPVQGATMYVNTFPCHICARHIVASGIKRLVYVEPYPKSLTSRLFNDSIVVDPEVQAHDKVSFECFKGVAPRIFRFSFRLNSARKDQHGDPVRPSKSKATTRMKRYIASYLSIERHVVNNLSEKIINLGVESNE